MDPVRRTSSAPASTESMCGRRQGVRRRSRAEWTRRTWTSWRRRVSIRRRQVRDHPVRLGTDSSDYGVVSFLYVAVFVISNLCVALLHNCFMSTANKAGWTSASGRSSGDGSISGGYLTGGWF